MGNLFFSSSKKISSGSDKRGKVDLHASGNNNNNNQSDNDSSKKLKKSSCDSSSEQQPQQILQKIENNLDVDDKSPTKSSPFQRDYYLAPHEVLVPLEKYRPRRSNIRRSARQSNSSKNNSTSSDNKKFPVIKDDSLDDQSKESSINCPKDVIISENSIPETLKDNNDDDKELPVDELDPSERNKVARNKLSELLRRQKQVMPVMNHQRKYQSAYEPNLDYYNAINDSECDPEKNPSENNGNKNEENTESGNNVEEVMIRRPRKPLLTHGNALLIDELKKRQSNFYESSRESSSDNTTEVQQQPKPLIANNNCVAIVESN